MDELRLADLSDEHLIQHLVRARDAGDHDQFKLSIDLLAWRRWDHVRGKVLAKVNPVDADDVAMEAMTSAIGSYDFRGTSMGEFVSGLNTIVRYRIADYHKKQEKSGEVRSTGQGEDGDAHGPEPAEPDLEIEETGTRLLFEEVLSRRSDVHRRVVELRNEGFSAKETAELVNSEATSGGGSGGEPSRMTPANVDKIFSRFNKDLRVAFEESGGL